MDREPSPLAGVILMAGPAFAVATWLAADAKRQPHGVIDAGFFFYLALPVAAPWYALRTRGPAGWKLAAQLYLLALAGILGLNAGLLIHILTS